MNRKEATEAAYSNTKTYGELLTMVMDKEDRGQISRINKGLSLDQSRMILFKCLSGKDSEEIPKVIHSRTRGLSGAGMIVKNVYWECG